MLEVAAGAPPDLSTDRHRSRERDDIHARVTDEVGAGSLPKTRADVEHASWNTGLEREFAQTKSCQGRLLGRLQHHRATRRERRRNLPARKAEREVPRNDRPDDSDRFST